MTKKYLFLLIILFSCKSTKKAVVENSRVDGEVISVSTSEIISDFGNVTKKTIITETTTEKYEEVEGTAIIKPVTTTTVITSIEESENKNQSIKKAIENNSIELSAFDSLSLDKETEGMEVVEEIVGGITGALIGDVTKWIIGGIFFIILLIVLSKLIRKKD